MRVGIAVWITIVGLCIVAFTAHLMSLNGSQTVGNQQAKQTILNVNFVLDGDSSVTTSDDKALKSSLYAALAEFFKENNRAAATTSAANSVASKMVRVSNHAYINPMLAMADNEVVRQVQVRVEQQFSPPEKYHCVKSRTSTRYATHCLLGVAQRHASFEVCVWPSDKDIHVSRSIADSGAWDAGKAVEMERAKRMFSDQSTVLFVDVGANLGFFSLVMAAAGAKVLSFEPLPANLGLIIESWKRNPTLQSNWKVFAAGLSEKVEQKTIYQDALNRGGSSFTLDKLKMEHVANVIPVTNLTLIPLDFVIKQKVQIMKIDVEGFESCVLAGGKKLFKEFGVAIIFLELWRDLAPPCWKDLPSLLKYMIDELNYKVFPSLPADKSMNPAFPTPESILDHLKRLSASGVSKSQAKSNFNFSFVKRF